MPTWPSTGCYPISTMRTVVLLFALLAAAAAAPQAIPWTSCGNATDMGKITNLTISPFPPGTLRCTTLELFFLLGIVSTAFMRSIMVAYGRRIAILLLEFRAMSRGLPLQRPFMGLLARLSLHQMNSIAHHRLIFIFWCPHPCDCSGRPGSGHGVVRLSG